MARHVFFMGKLGEPGVGCALLLQWLGLELKTWAYDFVSTVVGCTITVLPFLLYFLLLYF